MTAEIVKILSTYGQSTVDRIRNNLATTGTNASGKTAQSLRFTVTNTETKAILKITGKPYFMVVETGRKATPQYTKPSYDFVNDIRLWIASRGGDQGAAYAIAKMIHKTGTKLWQQGGRKDIVSNVVNQSLVDQISQDSLKQFAREYLVSTVNMFNDNRNQ